MTLDGCPNCVLNTELPWSVEQVSGGIHALYTCTDCGHSWSTDWKTEVPRVVAGQTACECENEASPQVLAHLAGSDPDSFSRNERG